MTLRGFPRKPFGTEVGGGQCQLDALVAGLSDVLADDEQSVDGRDAALQKQVAGVVAVDVELTRDARVEECEVDTEIHLTPGSGGKTTVCM